MTNQLPEPLNGYSVKEMIGLVLWPEVKELKQEVGEIKTEQATIIERLDKVATPENCPLLKDIEAIRKSQLDARDSDFANTRFRIQTKAILGFALILAGIFSSSFTLLVAHFL